MSFLRVLGWMLAVALLLNAVMAGIAYGDAPGYLAVGGTALAAVLAWTSPRVRGWFS